MVVVGAVASVAVVVMPALVVMPVGVAVIVVRGGGASGSW